VVHEDIHPALITPILKAADAALKKCSDCSLRGSFRLPWDFRVRIVKMPAGLYDLRLHISMVRQRLLDTLTRD
jgi:hypothetical protein